MRRMLTIPRRALLTASLAATAPRAAWAQQLSRGAFTHGVASGDPLPDGVMLWARFVGDDGRIAWEIAEDEAFMRVAQRGEARALMANDFCAKADVRGLAPGRRYYYRFLSASGPSLTGQTCTAPARGGERLTVALFSCANFGWGYFHAYGHAAARDDIDLVLHAGDYIYEMQRGAFPNDADAAPGRIIDPVNETVSLSDYYQRYAVYHTDPDLLELRRAKPMSVVWDDHEIANDAWREGAGAHQDYEGAYSDRIAAASKAYFDWMPIRRPDARGPRLYRSLDWGDLARILLLDTRYIGRDRQLDYRTGLRETTPDAVRAFRAELEAPNRTLLGGAQERWFADALAQSKQRGQTWQIITQQVLVGDQIAPTGLTRLLPQGAQPGWFGQAEAMRAFDLPWNLDCWAGYPAARTRFLDACATHASNAVVLGGDSHNCWLNNLDAPHTSRLAAIEFGGGSVTSPGFERSLTNAAPGEREALLRSANPQLAFCDFTQRGYGALTFTRSACEAEWVAFESVREAQRRAPAIARIASSASAHSGPGGWSVSPA
jgi:alkaline phosphatase D